MAVRRADAEGFDKVVDLVAFDAAKPDRWRLRTGQGWALGADLLLGDAPVRAVATPWAWMQAEGRALCILDWQPRDEWLLLHDAPPILAEPAIASRLRAAAARWAPPRIWITDYA